jgi:hypothetical protein
LPFMKLNYLCQALNAIPVHSSCFLRIVALLPVAVLIDSLKISFGYQLVSEI